jgi:hypothetical protein
MNANNDFKIQEYKACAGRKCNNIAKHFLTIVLIKKSGWFCEKCKQSLQADDLVESIVKSL